MLPRAAPARPKEVFPVYQNVIVKKPCRAIVDGISTAGLGLPDYELALKQHACYVEALKKCGVSVTELPADEGGKRERLYLGNKADTTAVTYRVGGVPSTLLLSMSEEMRGKLIAQWKLMRR